MKKKWRERMKSEMMKKREKWKRIKVIEPIESPRFNWNESAVWKIQSDGKGVKEEMNGGKSEKKKEEGLEICETGENILP